MSRRTLTKEYQKVCPCGKTFKAKAANAIYCSTKCTSHYYYANNKKTSTFEPKELACALESCDKKFTQKSPNQKYCSKDCSHIKNHGSLPAGEIEKVCETCGNTFKTKTHNKKYCKESCQPPSSYTPVVPKKGLKERKCELEGCDNKFIPPSSTPNKKFCCREHSSQHHRNLTPPKPKVTKTLTCEWCGETFERTGYEANLKQVKFCSSKCNHKSLQARKKLVTNHSSKIALTKKGKVTDQGDFKLGLPDYRFGDPTSCTYCGDSLVGVQSGVDHCIPQSFFLDVGVPESNARGLTCPSCHKCNSLLSDKIFDTFKQRRGYLTNVYQTVVDRYFNEENTWTEEELDEHNYDYVLRKFIEQKIWNRYVLLDKVDWPFSAEYGEIIEAVEFDIKYTGEFNEAQLPLMRRFFEIEDNLIV